MDEFSSPLTAVGIQLGSSFYRMGRLQNGSPVTLLNKFGKDETPAYFALDGQDALYGDDAVAHASIQPHNTTKNVMKQFSAALARDPLLQDNNAEDILRKTLKGLIFDAIPGWDGKPTIRAAVVTCANWYLQVNREIIEKLVKKILDEQCPNVVTALVPKSTAAFVAYTMHSEKVPNGRYLVLVIGAFVTEMATFDVENKIARSIGGQNSVAFGGETFDQLLVEYCCDQFHEDSGIDARNDSVVLQTLLTKCEIVKRKLSAAKVALLEIPQLCQSKKLKVQIARETLETLGAAAVEQFASFLKTTVAGCDFSEYSGIIVVGGASRMPWLQRTLAEIFPKSLIKSSMNPDAHVAVLNGATFLTCAFASAELAASLSAGKLDFELMKRYAKNNALQYLSHENIQSGHFLLPAPQTRLDAGNNSQRNIRQYAAVVIKDSSSDCVSEDDGEDVQQIVSLLLPTTTVQDEPENLLTDDEDNVDGYVCEKGPRSNFEPVTSPTEPDVAFPPFSDKFASQHTEYGYPPTSPDLPLVVDQSAEDRQSSSMPVLVVQPRSYGPMFQQTATVPTEEELPERKRTKRKSNFSLAAKKQCR